MSRVMIEMNKLIDEISMGPFGSDIKVDNFVDKGVPVLNGSNVTGVRLTEESFNYVTPEKAKSLKKANVKRGDIVITHRGTLGQIAFIPENSLYDNYVISQSQFKVTLKADKVDPAYFTYYFHTNEGQKRLLSFKNHVGVPALAQATTNFRKLEFPLIPLVEQQKIAKVLSDIDAKIELNNKINAELEAMAKTLYDYWFVQFDFPDANSKPYKSSGGKIVWNEELKREIPEGWEVKKINSKIKIGSGFPFDSSKYLKKGDYKIITIKNVQDLRIDTDNVDYINEIPEKINSFCILEIGDVLMSLTGNVGRICIVPENNLLLNQRVGKIICDELYKNFSYLFFQRIEERQRLEKIATGSSQKNLSPVDAVESIALFPSEKILKKFNQITVPIMNRNILSIKENQELASLRDWLLPMLMNGQVSVGGYEVEDSELEMVAEEKVEYKKS